MATTRAEATPPDGILALPTGYTPESRRHQFIQTSPAPGGQLRLTYVDADLEPRIELTVDPNISDEDRELLRRVLRQVGDRLAPVKKLRAFLGPRLLPCALALTALKFVQNLAPLAV